MIKGHFPDISVTLKFSHYIKISSPMMSNNKLAIPMDKEFKSIHFSIKVVCFKKL